MSKKKIFLTGGNGFIGRNFREILSSKYEILAPGFSDLDLLDFEAVRKYLADNPVDVVVHSAAVGVNRNTASLQTDVFKKNLLMFYNLCACKEYYDKMIVFGSGAEYDKRNPLCSVSENDFGKSTPIDDYGLAKFTMSKLAENSDYITHLRFFGVFGKYEDYTTRFISNAICRKIMGLPITIRKNVFFDYIFIKDLVMIIDFLINSKSKTGFYNVGTGKPIDLVTIGKMIERIGGGKDVGIKVKEEGLNNEYTCDVSRLKNIIKDFEVTPIEKAIAELFDYYRSNLTNIKKESL